MQKNNSAQVGQNFHNQLPDNLSGIKNDLQPSWSEVQNPTSAQPGQKLKITSPQVAAKWKMQLRHRLCRSYNGVIAQKKNRRNFHPTRDENCSGLIISLEMSASDPDQHLQWSKAHHHAA